MANKSKTGLDYFPFEVSFFSDIKLRKLIKYQGCKSTPIYTLLLCNIYKNGYYLKWDKELPFTISETTGYEEGYIKEVINCCLKVQLFDEKMFNENKILTSKGIQDRYELICKQMKRKANVVEFKIIVSEEKENPSEELRNPSEETIIDSEELPQRKGKERKQKETERKVKEKIEEILNSQRWIEEVSILQKIPPDETENYLKDFLTEQSLKEEIEHREIIEIKKHFINTLKILKEKNSAKKENGKSTNYDELITRYEGLKTQ